MKLIKPSFEIWEQPSGLEGVYKQIEHVGRVCYKSEDKITEDSAKPFVDRMIKSGHGAMLEHGTVYLYYSGNNYEATELYDKYKANPYSKVAEYDEGPSSKYHIFITTNLRVLVENGWLDDLQYICEPTGYHVKRVTVHFTCDRGVSHEFVRHRVFSFAQESTRYCNYSKDKFGNKVTFIIPNWVKLKYDYVSTDDVGNNEISVNGVEQDWYDEEDEVTKRFLYNTQHAERDYIMLLKEGCTPQQARAVLPNSLKTELVMTGFISDWRHFFDLRALGTTGAPHPQAKELAEPLMKEFIKRKYIND